MDYTSFLLSAIIILLGAIYVRKNDLETAKQEQTDLEMKKELEYLKSKNLEMKKELEYLKSKNLEMKKELEYLKSKNLEMKEALVDLKSKTKEITDTLRTDQDGINKLKATKAEKQQVETDLTKINKNIQTVQGDISASKNKGVTYVRWGKTACNGENTETVYTGQVGGGYYTHRGTSVNYVCMPNDPDAAKPLKNHDSYAYLHGAEYEIFDFNKPEGIRSGIGQHDVACAVCLTKGKASVMMIPGRKHCYKGWQSEYNGYLMGGHHGHAAASEYACVDSATEAIPGGSNDENGRLFYPVKTQCGSLKCPPYKGDTEVLCVVCTK